MSFIQEIAMYRSPMKLNQAQFDATYDIETVVAYQDQEGSSQLIVPTLNEDGKILSTTTVYARWQSKLSITSSIWQDANGWHYRVIPKSEFYPEEADCSCS